MQVIATDRDDETHTLSWSADASLMEVLRDAGLEVEAVCGGGCACATCHVFVAEAWRAAVGEPGDIERELLAVSEFYRPGESRLSCQIGARPELDGLQVTVAPEG